MELCRLNDVPFDVASSAGWYSAIAGLLAGFAFVAVLFPLTTTATLKASARQGMPSSSSSVRSSPSSSSRSPMRSWRPEPAEAPPDGIAAHEQMINGAAFGLSVLLLLFGLRAVLAPRQQQHIFDSAKESRSRRHVASWPGDRARPAIQQALDVERYRAGAGARVPCDTSGCRRGVAQSLDHRGGSDRGDRPRAGAAALTQWEARPN